MMPYQLLRNCSSGIMALPLFWPPPRAICLTHSIVFQPCCSSIEMRRYMFPFTSISSYSSKPMSSCNLMRSAKPLPFYSGLMIFCLSSSCDLESKVKPVVRRDTFVIIVSKLTSKR